MATRYDNIKEIEQDLDGKDLRVGIVMSRFNIDIGEGLLGACTAELIKRGVAESDMMLVTVPGALEVPLALQKLANTGKYDALIAIGAVIKGDTYHFEIVCNEASSGINAVQLDFGIPIANAILTTYTDDQAIQRMSTKGMEAAQVAIEMANLLRTVDEE